MIHKHCLLKLYPPPPNSDPLRDNRQQKFVREKLKARSTLPDNLRLKVEAARLARLRREEKARKKKAKFDKWIAKYKWIIRKRAKAQFEASYWFSTQV